MKMNWDGYEAVMCLLMVWKISMLKQAFSLTSFYLGTAMNIETEVHLIQQRQIIIWKLYMMKDLQMKGISFLLISLV